jgi:hypothetical protein
MGKVCGRRIPFPLHMVFSERPIMCRCHLSVHWPMKSPVTSLHFFLSQYAPRQFIHRPFNEELQLRHTWFCVPLLQPRYPLWGCKQGEIGRMPSSGTWCHVDLVRTDVLEERIASIFRVEKYSSKEPAWAGGSSFQPWRWRRYIPPKRQFTQDLHGVTSQKTVFFIATTVKTSNPARWDWHYWIWTEKCS